MPAVKRTQPMVANEEVSSFAEQLEVRANFSSKRKGERTRDRLKAAAARQLEEVGYRELRVTDINERAGVSNALFYIYFNNKEEITHEVLTEFVETLKPATPRVGSSGIFDTIYRGNLGYARVFAANPGLMRCLLQFGDEAPEFSRIWHDWNDAWTDRTLRALAKESPSTFDGAEVLTAVAALGLMVDGLLRLVYVEQHARVGAAVAEMGAQPEALAAFLTRLWCRALFSERLTIDLPAPPGLPTS